MRLCDPHQHTITGFANDFPLSSAPPPYSEYPTDQQRVPTRAHYLTMGIEPPAPLYTTATNNNNNDDDVWENDDRRRRRPRRPAPRYPPQPFPLPGDGCADTVLRAMTRRAEDELGRLEREADGRVADFCARKRRAAAPAAAGGSGSREQQLEEQQQQQQPAERPVRGVLLGRVEFEKGVAGFMEAFREGKKRIYDRLAHHYVRYMADMVWEALEANELLPSEYAKIMAQNPANSEVICLWDPDEENAEEEEEEREPNACGRDMELGNWWEVRIGETVVVSSLLRR
ncbi:uncharacterized protein P884DRAFT_313434 [Thermothelomyces heterothallicus CBS 202.75]|uniref:uncharacterized protein n=1 Tax=Thermothelomyces heterothallicus CBS 202.75 TaxID=1149848 RepID=UPI0037443175